MLYHMLTFVLLGVACLAPGVEAQSRPGSPLTAASFGKLDDVAKLEALKALRSGTTPSETAELPGVLATALSGAEAVKREGLTVLSAYLRRVGDPQAEVLRTRFRARVHALLQDPDESVRSASVPAIVGLDYRRISRDRSGISDATTGVLISAYAAEKADSQKSVLLEALVIYQDRSRAVPARVSDLVQAVLLSGSGKLKYEAVRLVRRRPMAHLLPEVAMSLTDTDQRIRRAAAETLGSFGPGASAFVGELTTAASAERDNELARQLREAIKKIAGSR